AVLAVGGQGGGVLSGWIRDLAESNGYHAQVTSVAGVAQRTGATIYYIEMAPAGPKTPVFALAPIAGDVDVLIAAEAMEAGRAAQRGFVTPDRTTLIASSHRILAIAEKQLSGDGRGDAGAVLEVLAEQSAKLIAFDMEAIAKGAGSLISASLFGALARSGALPFSVEQFRAVIGAAPKGAEASLRAFDAALAYEDSAEQEATVAETGVIGSPSLQKEWDALIARADAAPFGREMLRSGLAKVVDYQDVAYGAEYLDHVAPFLGHGDEVAEAAAKYLANAMCYDDIIRVADLKVRGTRSARVRGEQEIPDGEVVHVTEYFHPRAEEVTATMPRRLGAWIANTPWATRALERIFSKGRRIRSDKLAGFLLLWLAAGLRPWRRSLLRHQGETQHLETLKARALSALPHDPAFAAELLSVQRLIKGYSDTHARGHSRFDRVMAGAAMVEGRADAADWVRRLKEAALADVDGAALDGAIATIESFANAEERPAA
ncbi:MAG: indolepyruvate oxidoreductase subunit beta family protein, partial [Pseudomonadota bacterium]